MPLTSEKRLRFGLLRISEEATHNFGIFMDFCRARNSLDLFSEIACVHLDGVFKSQELMHRELSMPGSLWLQDSKHWFYNQRASLESVMPCYCLR